MTNPYAEFDSYAAGGAGEDVTETAGFPARTVAIYVVAGEETRRFVDGEEVALLEEAFAQDEPFTVEIMPDEQRRTRDRLIRSSIGCACIAFALGVVIGDIWHEDFKFLVAVVLAAVGFYGLVKAYKP